MPEFAKVRMISPMEMDVAFVLAAHRDILNPDLMDEWKRPGNSAIKHPHQKEITGFFIVLKDNQPWIPCLGAGIF